MTAFQLNHRLEQDSFLIGHVEFCQIRLLNDCRWLWLILIPQHSGLTELHELNSQEQAEVATITNRCAKLLKELTNCKKINSGVLGNVVPQLHIHIVARNEGDPNWPNPIWGFETARPYSDSDRDSLISHLRTTLQTA